MARKWQENDEMASKWRYNGKKGSKATIENLREDVDKLIEVA